MRTLSLTTAVVLAACGGDPVQIGAGGDQFCELDGRGVVTCWRYDFTDTDWWTDSCNQPIAELPQLELVDIAVAAGVACGIEPDGRLHCWGEFSVEDEGPWVDVVGGPGTYTACAIDQAGEVACFPEDGHLELIHPPQGPFTMVETGGLDACALDAGGGLTCWGRDEGGTASGAPSGAFVDVALNDLAGVAIDEGGGLQCWGDLDFCGEVPTGAGRWVQVEGGERHSCGLTRGGRTQCWGLDLSGLEPIVFEGAYVHMDAGGSEVCGGITCALDEAGRPTCRAHERLD